MKFKWVLLIMVASLAVAGCSWLGLNHEQTKALGDGVKDVGGAVATATGLPLIAIIANVLAAFINAGHAGVREHSHRKKMKEIANAYGQPGVK